MSAIKQEQDIQMEPSLSAMEPWPSATNFYLGTFKHKLINRLQDGSHMMLALDPLRTIALEQQTFETAEKVLESLAKKFALDKKGSCTLIFDSTFLKVDEPHFQVLSARPTFSSSANALVHYAQNDKGIFVTDDKDLIVRLKEYGAFICEPKEWFCVVARLFEQGNDIVNLLAKELKRKITL
jgi:hypothetical protein